jgi:hypothetical protein
MLLTSQKCKLKGYAGTVVRCGPEAAPVTFHNRPTDRQTQAQAPRLGGMERIKDSFGAYRIKPDAKPTAYRDRKA